MSTLKVEENNVSSPQDRRKGIKWEMANKRKGESSMKKATFKTSVQYVLCLFLFHCFFLGC